MELAKLILEFIKVLVWPFFAFVCAEPKPAKPPATQPQWTIQPVKQTDANKRMLTLGLQPSPSGLDLQYYRSMVEEDPNLALAGLRMELEILGRNLGRGFHVPLPDNIGAMTLFRKLLDAGAITNLQFQLLQRIIQLCNAAVHGQQVTKEQANSVIELTKFLADDYTKWLSWGFPEQS